MINEKLKWYRNIRVAFDIARFYIDHLITIYCPKMRSLPKIYKNVRIIVFDSHDHSYVK